MSAPASRELFRLGVLGKRDDRSAFLRAGEAFTSSNRVFNRIEVNGSDRRPRQPRDLRSRKDHQSRQR